MSVPQDLLLPSLFSEADIRQFDRDLVVALNTWSLSLKSVLDKGLSLDNLDVAEVSYTSNAAPNTEDTIAHKLGRVPKYFLVGSQDKAGIAYLGATAWTSQNVYLKNSVASVAIKLILL